MIKLVPSVFSGGGKAGDFQWMLSQDAWATALFVFNDNTSQSTLYLDQFARGHVDPKSQACSVGGGNGAIRPFQCEDPPRAAGVPTGPGFKALDATSKPLIDRALTHIHGLLAGGGYDRVIYSAKSASEPNVLGHGIFDVPDDVLTFVPAQLAQIVAQVNAAAND